MKCHDLDPDTHAVLERASASVHPRSGKSRTTPAYLSDELGFSHREVSALLADLEGHGFVDVDRRYGHIRVIVRCQCALSAPLLDTTEVGGYSRTPARTPAQTSPPSPIPSTTTPPTGGLCSEGNGVHSARTSSEARYNLNRSNRQNSRELSESKSSGPVRVVGRRRKVHRGPKPPELMTASDLAVHFKRSVMRNKAKHGTGWVGGVNEEALRGNFARWRREDGVTSAEIYEMIEIFATAKLEVRGGIPVWKRFLSDRQMLLEKARRSAVGRGDDEDPLAWGAEAPADPDPLGWGPETPSPDDPLAWD